MNTLNNSKILSKALEMELTESQLQEKRIELYKKNSIYSNEELSGIIWHFGEVGLIKIVLFCEMHKLKCHYEVDYTGFDSGEVIFELL